MPRWKQFTLSADLEFQEAGTLDEEYLDRVVWCDARDDLSLVLDTPKVKAVVIEDATDAEDYLFVFYKKEE